MKNIAIIPARSGSKGLRDKNVRLMCGRPLLAYTIEAAFESEQFDEVMVSTDSDRYAEIAKAYGAQVPFLRDPKTSGDTANSWDVVDEVLTQYRERYGKVFDTFCLLQPTSPLRDRQDIKAAYQLFYQKASFAVVSVCEAEHSPLWCGYLPESQELVNFVDRKGIMQRQAGEKFYRLNGAIYLVDVKRFSQDRFLYQEGSFAYIMEQKKSIDIDTEIDFQYAELLMKSMLKTSESLEG